MRLVKGDKTLWPQGLKIRPDHGTSVVVGGRDTTHPRSVGKRRAGRRDAGFPMARNERGARSARTEHGACATSHHGPKASGHVREVVPKTVQHRPVAPGLPEYRSEAWQYDRRSGWEN